MIDSPFVSLSPSAARALVDASSFKRLVAGAVVFADGDPGDSLILISSGLIAVQVAAGTEAPVTVALRGPGDLLGETALFASSPRRTATAVARSDAHLLALDRDAFQSLRKSYEEVDDLFLRILAERSASLTRRLAERNQPSMVTLVHCLLSLPTEIRVPRSIVVGDLAGLTGLSETAVTEALDEMKSRGWVETSAGSLIVDQPAIRAAASLP
ncbi:MAG: cyclic nucleotide-binding domain-containing protein [Actinomycetes bacterium]